MSAKMMFRRGRLRAAQIFSIERRTGPCRRLALVMCLGWFPCMQNCMPLLRIDSEHDGYKYGAAFPRKQSETRLSARIQEVLLEERFG
jgi:hypothetical protein